MRKLRTMHLFAGAGGGILADVLLGHQPVCAVEIDEYCQQVLSARQEDGCFPWFPIFEDVQAFDGRPWRGLVDVVSGGFPCQDISVAGSGAGLDGERSGLWREMARIIGEVRPRFVFVENSPALVTRGLDRVLSDLAAMGFDARWGIVSAADTGAPHRRERIWIFGKVSNAELLRRNSGLCGQEGQQPSGRRSSWCEPSASGEDLDYSYHQRQQRIIAEQSDTQGRAKPNWRPFGSFGHGFGCWPTESGLGRVADGVAHRAHRIKCLGNGQVPRVAAAAWELLYGN